MFVDLLVLWCFREGEDLDLAKFLLRERRGVPFWMYQAASGRPVFATSTGVVLRIGGPFLDIDNIRV